MAKYDDASWHYDGDYPNGLPNENASTHIGMFLAWCINNSLISDELQEDSEEEVNDVKSRKMTGGEFLRTICDEKFIHDDLSELGQDFANDYYDGEKSKFAKKFNDYGNDFCNVFNEYAKKNNFEYESLYHVEDTWKNYDLMAKRLDERFAEWKSFTKK